MALVQSCEVLEGDELLHPVRIRYEQDGQVYERLTSAEEVLAVFEKIKKTNGYICMICGSTEPNIHSSGNGIPRHY